MTKTIVLQHTAVSLIKDFPWKITAYSSNFHILYYESLWGDLEINFNNTAQCQSLYILHKNVLHSPYAVNCTIQAETQSSKHTLVEKKIQLAGTL